LSGGPAVSSDTARQPRQQEEKAPVFPADVDVVAVDVNVVDRDGRPVRGLGPEDFALTVDGKSRRILSVDFVDLAGETRPEPPPPSPYFSTNVGVHPGRLVLIAVDQNNIAFGGGRSVLNASDRLLDTLGPNDQVGLLSLASGGPSVEFTGEHVLVREALGKIVGRARRGSGRIGLSEALAYLDGNSFVWQQVLQRECGSIPDDSSRLVCNSQMADEASAVAHSHREGSRTALRMLSAAFDALRTIEGPKTLVLVTEGLGVENDADVRDLASRAAAARASLFILQLDSPLADAGAQRVSPTSVEDKQTQDAGIWGLAAMTRGTVFRLSGSGDRVFERIARELSGYYLLGFEPEGGDRDGKDHRIRVDVERPGLTVRSRGRMNIPPAGVRPRTQEVLVATLRAPFLIPDLPVRVATFALPDTAAGKVRVLVSAEVERARGALDLAFVILDDETKPVASGGGRVTESPAGVSSFVGGAQVEPGQYTLRLAAVDDGGRRGSVEHTVKAALVSAGGLELGDLLLGPPPAEGGTLRPATDVRADGGLIAHVEMSAREPGRLKAAAVSIEVAESDSGPVLLQASAPGTDSPEGTRRMARAVLPLQLLPPGSYVARAAVSVDRKPVASLSRPFRLTSSIAGPGGGRGIPIAGLSTSLSRFEREALLRPAVVGHFLDRVSSLVPGPPPAELQPAMDRARRGELGRVLEALPSAARDDPRLAFLRGLGYLDRGEIPAASTQFRSALRQASDLLPASVYLGACYAASGEDRQAVGAWQTALVTETGALDLYLVLADALLRVNEPQRAAELLTEARASWAEDDGLKRRLGIAYAMSGDEAQALPLLSAHLERHPDDLGALFVTLRLLFQAFAERGSEAGAAGERERLVRYAKTYVDARGPNQEIVAHWLRYLEKGR
jgi:VWFA-related protein